MTATVILSDALRGSLTTAAFPVAASTPKFIRIALTSPTFAADPTLQWNLTVERSLDGGATWDTYCASTNVGGFGLAAQNVRWDGAACLLRASIAVPTPFTWGLTVDTFVLP